MTGTRGLEGKWRSTKVDVSSPGSYVIRESSNGVYQWQIPDYKISFEGKLDGSDHAISGPTIPRGQKVGFKQLSPMKIAYTEKLNGKPRCNGSPDHGGGQEIVHRGHLGSRQGV